MWKETANLTIFCVIFCTALVVITLPLYISANSNNEEDIGEGVIEWSAIDNGVVKMYVDGKYTDVRSVTFEVHNNGYKKANIFTGDFTYKTRWNKFYGPIISSLTTYTLTNDETVNFTLFFKTTDDGYARCLMIYLHTKQV